MRDRNRTNANHLPNLALALTPHQMVCFAPALLLALTALTAASSTHDNILERIDKTHSLLSTKGPTFDVLNHYDSMVQDVESYTGTDLKVISQLPQLYFKKALIELSLNREIRAIDDLKRVLELDPSMVPARTKIVELMMERGDVNGLMAITNVLDESEESVVKEKIAAYNHQMEEAEKCKSEKDYAKCMEHAQGAIELAPLGFVPYQLHLECSKLGELSSDTYRLIIRDLAHMIKHQKSSNLSWYEEIAGFLLYFTGQFDQAKNYIKQCIKVDNEFKDCTGESKFFSKYGDFLKQLEAYSILLGHLYSVADQGSTKAVGDPEVDFEKVANFLFNDDLKVTKLESKKLPYSVKTNYDYLVHKQQGFVKKHLGSKFKGDIQFVQDLDRLGCEALVSTNRQKEADSFCKKVHDVPENKFLPKYLKEIDTLLASKKYQEAHNMLELFNNQVKHTSQFQKRAAIIEEYQRKVHARQQQQQRQFHRQQQQRQQQQQQQQQQRHNYDVKKDYYKILDIGRDADEKTIRKAYRAKTLKYHPDKQKGSGLTPEEMEAKMQEVNQAYEVLSDKELKERYDRGDDPNDPRGAGGGGGGFPHGGQGGPGFQFNGDIFSQFMNQGGGGAHFNFGGFGGQQKVKVKRKKKN